MRSQKSDSKLSGLQVMRALAAGMVVFFHGIPIYQDRIGSDISHSTIYGFGDLGVKLFFCISGFIIYLSAANLPSGAATALSFLRRRFIRIAPLYWLVTLALATRLLLQGHEVNIGEVIKSILFIPYPNEQGVMRPLLVLGWTLNFEMFFYALMGASLFLPQRFRLISISLSLLILVAGGLTGAFAHPALVELRLLASPYLLFFLAGLYVGRIHLLQHKLKNLGLIESVSIITLLLAGLVNFSAHAAAFGPEYLAAFEIATCSAVIFVAAEYTPSKSVATNGLYKSLVLAGDGSYSTYLTHVFLMGPFARMIVESGATIGMLPFCFLSVAFCTLAGFLFFRYAERPINSIVSKVLPR